LRALATVDLLMPTCSAISRIVVDIFAWHGLWDKSHKKAIAIVSHVVKSYPRCGGKVLTAHRRQSVFSSTTPFYETLLDSRYPPGLGLRLRH